MVAGFMGLATLGGTMATLHAPIVRRHEDAPEEDDNAPGAATTEKILRLGPNGRGGGTRVAGGADA